MESRHLISLALLSLGLSRAAQAADLDKHICVRCEDVLTAYVREKHLGGMPNSPEDRKACDAECEFKSSPAVTVRISCGLDKIEDRTLKPLGRYREVPGLELNASLQEMHTNTEGPPYWALQFSDKDTPCLVTILWSLPDPNAETKAIALARDVAAALTPAVTVDKPTREAIVWNVDETGDKAKATLGAWDKEKDAVNALLKLSPGFPRLMDDKDRAGLPAGKKQLVFGFCPNLQAKQLLEVLDTALPGADWYRVDGRGVSPSCPATDKEWQISDKARKRVGKLELSTLVLESKFHVRSNDQPSSPPVTYIYAYLRDSSGRLVDFKSLDARLETFTSDPSCSRKLKVQGNAMVVRTTCKELGIERCKVPPKVIQTTRIDVAEGKLKTAQSSEKIDVEECEWAD
jgi:hypothetical protein